MESTRHHCIDHELLRLTLQASDPAGGYGTDIHALGSGFRQWMPDVADREIVEALKRLRPQYVTLWKWSSAKRWFIEYPNEIDDDVEFFYRDNFRLRRTPHTGPYLQELATLSHDPEDGLAP
jgi:hypothetical protein